ncbi:MAG: CDP-diacylglycerol--glycerol-3-phosphate 3-phosphatidyltransferase [Gammaproteobacteria bacterium]
MQWNAPNLLTLLRIVLIPLFVIAYYLPYRDAHILATVLFVVAAITDWLDGYLARRLQQLSPFGAFLDPVADKLMVAAALVMLAADPRIYAEALDARVFAIVVLVILGREITVSALREWMAELGNRSRVAVSFVGKFKTTAQMFAIPFLIWREPLWGLPVFRTGEILLYAAAALTLWSMLVYLRLAWPSLMQPNAPTRKP